MEVSFIKMHGLGNDFILVDCLHATLPDPAGFARKYCDRRFGIGADQLLLLLPSASADFRMAIYNADGSEVEMCGNGIRCLAKYVWDRGISTAPILAIETPAGIIRPEKAGDLVRVDMGIPIFSPEHIPVRLDAFPPVIDYPLAVLDRELRVTFVSMGNPHAVIFLDEPLGDFPVALYGPAIEHHPLFPKRTNVEFINLSGDDELAMRVWERGTGETLACGTGATAAAVAAMLKGLTGRTVTVRLTAGNLVIEWSADNHAFMTGPAAEVYRGAVRV